MRNLLDGVFGFFVVPIEAHFFEYTGFWVDYAIRRSLPVELTFEEVLTRIEQAVVKSNQKSGNTGKYGGDSIEAERWNVEELLDYLAKTGRESFVNKDYRGFINAYVEGIYLSLKGELPPPSTRFIEKTVENAEFACFLKKLYPDAKFIHIVRNPYAALVSTRKFITLHGHYPYLGTVLDALENSYYYAFHNPLIIDDYLILKYEDLILDTDAKMRQVASFLEVSFDEKMLSPTALGKDWFGNSMSGQKFNGISKHPLSVWKTDISSLEIELVNLLLPHVLNKFDYEEVHSSSSLYLPVKGEGIRKYIANRFYWLTVQIKRNGSTSS